MNPENNDLIDDLKDQAENIILKVAHDPIIVKKEFDRFDLADVNVELFGELFMNLKKPRRSERTSTMKSWHPLFSKILIY